MSNLSNIERISEEMHLNYHQMQHFISESSWSARSVFDTTSLEVSRVLPKRKLTGLLIDESGWEKKGDKSVGVKRQYCGNVGKVSNCQVAVFASLSNGNFSSMVDARLYLPAEWCDDAARCDEAGIPEEERVFKTKSELALEIIRHQTELGVCFDFVSGDGYYGNDTRLAEGIEEMGHLYMLDIHSDQYLFTKRPELVVPQKKGTKGRAPVKLKPTEDGITAVDYMQSLHKKDWTKITVRNTAKGKLTCDYHFKQVYIWDKQTNQILPRLLMIRRSCSPKGEIQYKYSFTNANLDQYTQKALAYMQAQRYFVEHCIKESKQILGLDKFQTRKWLAWQHQAALNFIVSSFILKEKLRNIQELPLLSARDIKEMLVFKLYRQLTEEDFCERLYQRHLRRQQDINHAYIKQESLNLLK